MGHHQSHSASVANSGFSPIPLAVAYPPSAAVAAAVAASASSSAGSTGSASSPLGTGTGHSSSSASSSALNYGSGGNAYTSDNIQSSGASACHPNSQAAHWVSSGGRPSHSHAGHLLSQNHFGAGDTQVKLQTKFCWLYEKICAHEENTLKDKKPSSQKVKSFFCLLNSAEKVYPKNTPQ